MRVFGEVLGVTGRAGVRRTKQAQVAGRNLCRTAAEYVTEESRDVVPRAELDAFHDDVDALRDDVERIAAKIDAVAPNAGRAMKSALRALRIGCVLLRYRPTTCWTAPRSAGYG